MQVFSKMKQNPVSVRNVLDVPSDVLLDQPTSHDFSRMWPKGGVGLQPDSCSQCHAKLIPHLTQYYFDRNLSKLHQSLQSNI